MNLPIKTITVDRDLSEPREYMLKHLGAVLGFSTGLKLGALLAGPLGAVLGGMIGLKPKEPTTDDVRDVSLSASDLSPESLASTLERLGLSLEDPKVMEVIGVLMTTVSRVVTHPKTKQKEHQPIVWDVEFQGEMGAVLEVALEAARYNFKSFFSTGPAKGLRLAGLKLGGSTPQTE